MKRNSIDGDSLIVTSYIYSMPKKDWSRSLWVDNKTIADITLSPASSQSTQPFKTSSSHIDMLTWWKKSMHATIAVQAYLHYFPLCDLDFTDGPTF